MLITERTLIPAMDSGPENSDPRNPKGYCAKGQAFGISPSPPYRKRSRMPPEIDISDAQTGPRATAEKMGYQPNPMAGGLAEIKRLPK